MNTKEIVLSARDINKSFQHPVNIKILDNLNLTVEKGDTVAIVGRSGQGKSTLLQILGTLEKPCSGDLTICGQKVNRFNVGKIRNQHIAFIFQSFHLLEDYTAIENVLMPAKIARLNTAINSHAYKRALLLLDRVGLKDRANYNTKLLSGGEKQRVAIARALCNEPDIIFADEPSGNLDKTTAALIHDLLLNFAREENKTLIIVTHDMQLADLCSKKYTLENFKLN